jgi:hypothetical protein
VLLEVADQRRPRAEVCAHSAVETRVPGADPPRDVLLLVKDGLLDSIELVAYGDDKAS